MYNDDRPVLALAEGRVCTPTAIVARQRMLVARLMLSGRSFAPQADLLSAFEEDLAIFDRHLAVLREHQTVPASSRR